MAFTLDGYTIPVKSGPSKEQLEHAIKALAEARKIEDEFFAKAAAQGKRPRCITGNDYDYQSVVLMGAYLRWTLPSRFLNYRINACADIVYRHGNDYVVEFNHRNRRTRILKASQETSYLLEPDTCYDYQIIYNPDTRIGHVSVLGKHAT